MKIVIIDYGAGNKMRKIKIRLQLDNLENSERQFYSYENSDY